MSNEPCSLSLQTISPGEHMIIVEPGHTWIANDEQAQSLLAWLHSTPDSFTTQRWAVVSSRLTLFFYYVDAPALDNLLFFYGATPQPR